MKGGRLGCACRRPSSNREVVLTNHVEVDPISSGVVRHLYPEGLRVAGPDYLMESLAEEANYQSPSCQLGCTKTVAKDDLDWRTLIN